jgi:hypothetical protein
MSGTKYLETGLTNKENFPGKVKNELIEGIFIFKFDAYFLILDVQNATNINYMVKVMLSLCLGDKA